MAYNALYGYDTGLYGFGPANMTGPSADGTVQPLQRTYPAWMQDVNARGIGNAEDDTQGIPAFIPLNSGPLTSAATQAADAAAANPAPVSGIQSFSTTSEGGGNGGGAASQQDVLGGTGGSTTGPTAGDLSSADLNAEATSDNPGAQIASGPGFDALGTNGAFGGLENSPSGVGGDTAASGANGANSDTSAGGAQGGGDVGSSSEIVGHARGGIIGRNALMGPDPKGPDSGWGKLEVGEGVLTDKALKHYGKGIVARLNRLQVPKARLRA